MPDSEAASDTSGDHGDTASGHDPFDGAPVGVAAEPDYYAVLGVHPDTPPEDVRHAYHRLAMLWHPDRFMSAPPALRERAERRARALNAAYDVLGDPARRAAYDLRAPVTHPHHHHAPHHAPHYAAHPARTNPSARHQHQRPDAVGDIYDNGRAVATPGSDGTGIFLGGLVAIIALMVIVAALKQQDSTMGRYITMGLGLILVGVAFWCVTQSNALTRLANQVLAGVPTVPPEDRAPNPSHAHSDHTDHADHTSHAEHPDHAAPTDAHSEAHSDVHTGDKDDMDDAAFEQLVSEAVATIPTEFQAAMQNVVVRVKRNPSPEDIARLSVRENGLLLGLYEGVDATRQGVAGAPLPEVITIFRRPIEHYCRHNPDRIREQIRRTVLHELAHHFGIDHDAMPDWIR